MRQSNRSVALLLSQRGAVLPLIGFLIIAMLALAAFAVDIGYIMVTKQQLQNAADACALAAAPALRFDEPTKSSEVQNIVLAMAARHKAGNDSTVYIVPAEDIIIDGYKLTVYARKWRSRSNGLPLFFAKILRIPFADVSAKAAVLATPTKTACCIKPWSLPDLWDDTTPITGYPTWRNNDAYDAEEFEDGNDNRLYDPGEAFTDGNGNGVYDGEHYDRALSQANEAGYIPSLPPSGHIGMQLLLKLGSQNQRPATSYYNPVVLPWPEEYGGARRGADAYKKNITDCNPMVIQPGQEVELESEPGNMVGPTNQGTKTIIQADPYAFWNEAINDVDHTGGGNIGESPRIVLVPVFDPRTWPTTGRLTTQRGNAIVITKIVAFFIEDLDKSGVITGRVTRAPVSCIEGTEPGEGDSFTWSYHMVE